MGFYWKGFYLKIAEWLLSSYQMTSSWNIKDGMRKVWDINKAVILKIQLKPTQYMNITSTMMKHVWGHYGLCESRCTVFFFLVTKINVIHNRTTIVHVQLHHTFCRWIIHRWDEYCYLLIRHKTYSLGDKFKQILTSLVKLQSRLQGDSSQDFTNPCKSFKL